VVNRRVSRACLAEHPHANTDRTNASNSALRPFRLFEFLISVTGLILFTYLRVKKRVRVKSKADKGKGRYDGKRPNLAQFVVELLELYILLA
jgi:hypothetical protein